MKWEEIRKTYPDQYVVLKTLKYHINGNKKYIDDMAVVRIIQDPKEATRVLVRSKLADIVEENSEDYLIGNDDLSLNDCGEINRNDDIIKDAISQSSIIIAAWGNSPNWIKPLYKRRIEIVKNLIKNLGKKSQTFYVKSLSNEKNPKHAQIWGYADKMIEYKNL